MSQLLIPYDDLRAKGIRYSKPHLWRLEKAGKFPRRVPIGAARYGYVEAEIDDFITGLIAARDAGATGTSEKPKAAQRGEKRHAADRP
jgi:prophage regulatory protein